LPSAAEGLSISMLEAMSSGLAPIVTAVGGAPEVITHQQDGLLIAPDDLEQLETALQQLIESDAMTTQLGRAARDRVVARFSVDQSVDALADLYRTVSKQNSQ
jgi:glycosyltransferase involved in cell wall biosynthesis